MPHIKLTYPDGRILEVEVPAADLVPTLEKLCPVKTTPFAPIVSPHVQPYIFPTYRCVDYCTYPSIWFGIYPPPCSKCGQYAQMQQPYFTWGVGTTSTFSASTAIDKPTL